MIRSGTYTIEELNNRPTNHLAALLRIHFTEMADEYLVGTMPVDHRTRQPKGILPGGASVVLAETGGSIASILIVDNDKWIGVELEVKANLCGL